MSFLYNANDAVPCKVNDHPGTSDAANINTFDSNVSNDSTMLTSVGDDSDRPRIYHESGLLFAKAAHISVPLSDNQKYRPDSA